MKLSRFVVPVDLPLVLCHLQAPLRLLGMAMLVPLAVALLHRESEPAVVFAVLAAGCYALGRLRARAKLVEPSTKDALMIASCVYLIFGCAGALAYWPSASYLDGLFESMSGFTTTGLSVLDPEALPRSLVFFRSFSQWIGGAGIVVLSIALLPGPKYALVQLYSAESKDDNVLGSIAGTTRLVFTIYGVLTALAAAAYALVGMSVFDAVLHAFSTISTGGFSPRGSGIGYYQTPWTKLVVALFMIAGATSFPLWYRARREGLRRLTEDAQLRTLVLFIATGSAVAILSSRSPTGAWNVVDGVFHIVSSITTTGFNTTDPQFWSPVQWVLSTPFMILGGSAGSTAGGIKLVRVLALIAVVRWWLARAVLPAEARLPIRVGDRVLTADDVRNVTGFVAMYLGLICVSTMLLMLSSAAPSRALFESTSALGTVGLSAGVTSASLPFWAKLVLIFDMWVGRLEILPVLIWFYPGTWRRVGGHE